MSTCSAPSRHWLIAFAVLITAGLVACDRGSASASDSPDKATAAPQTKAAPAADAKPAAAKKKPAKSPTFKDIARNNAAQTKKGEQAGSAAKTGDESKQAKKKKRNRGKGKGAGKKSGNNANTGSKAEISRRVQNALDQAKAARERGDNRTLTPRKGPRKAGANTRKLTTQEKRELDGRFHQAPGLAIVEMTPEQQEQAAALEAIGYLDGSTMATGIQDVVVNETDKTWGKYNLYCSGHAPAAYLIDMEGNLLHSWYCDFATAFPDELDERIARGENHWRKVYLYENGDILAIFEGQGIIKVDKDSNLLWANANNAHHDLEVMPNGDIYVLTRKAHMIPRLNPKQPIMEDFVTILNENGEEKKSISLIEALEDTEFFKLWPAHRNKRGDVFHTNTLHVLDGSIAETVPEFKKGNVLFSILRFAVVAVLDMETEKVTWAHRGTFRSQHDPKILETGNMMIFDNKGGGGSSNVLVLDPATREEVWKYGGTKEKPFYSATCGTAERLANGNILAVESDGGRAFELTEDKDIVWEFYNPNRAGEQNEYIATLFDVIRLPESLPIDWASGPAEEPAPESIVAEESPTEEDNEPSEDTAPEDTEEAKAVQDEDSPEA